MEVVPSNVSLDAASQDINLGSNRGKSTGNHGRRVFIALIILHDDRVCRVNERKVRRVVQDVFIACSMRYEYCEPTSHYGPSAFSPRRRRQR
jgi:hypothetical protein